MNRTVLASAIMLISSGLAQAQDGPGTVEEVVVTGTSVSRSAFDTPLSVSSFSEDDLRKVTFSSQADVLQSMPGIKAEGGGGEVATNLQVRGLPSSGQFQFTPLQYDGLPTLSTFGLNSSAHDVYARNDLGIERLEFVRSGVSNLFGAGSVAGIVNYITKTGSDTPESTVQFEVAEEGRYRTDFATSGPFGDSGRNYYALSGFYRLDEGPLDSGLDTEGMQIRANFKHEFDDGHFTLYGQYIDDQVQFFLPLPLDGANQERLTGNDGKTVYTLNTVEAARLSYPTATGRFESPIEEGVATKGFQLSYDFERAMGGSDWTLKAKGKYADYSHQFNLFLDGDGQNPTPESLDQYLNNSSRNFLGAGGSLDLDNASYTFSGSGLAVPSDYRVFGNRTLDRDRPLTDYTSELNLSKQFDFGGNEHYITIGHYFSRAEAGDYNIITRYLGEFNNQPRLIDLSYTDVDGSLTGTAGTVVALSENGVTGAGVGYNNKEFTATRSAFYLADQIEADRWSFDIGTRIERIEGDMLIEGSETVVVRDDITLAPNLQTNRTGTGRFTRGSVSDTAIAVAGAFLYRVNDNINVFGNVSQGFFFPELRSVRFNAEAQPESYEAEDVLNSELGLRYRDQTFDGSVTLYRVALDNRRSVEFVDSPTGIREEISTQSTEATGIELSGEFDISDSLSIVANMSYEDHEFAKDEGKPENVGKEFRRKPNLIGNLGFSYDQGGFDASLNMNYHGDNFANDANTIELDAYTLVTLQAGYTMDLGDDESLRFGVSVWNLTDSQGVTEGSPRQGNNQAAGEYFVGRPILPRRVTLKATYRF